MLSSVGCRVDMYHICHPGTEEANKYSNQWANQIWCLLVIPNYIMSKEGDFDNTYWRLIFLNIPIF